MRNIPVTKFLSTWKVNHISCTTRN